MGWNSRPIVKWSRRPGRGLAPERVATDHRRPWRATPARANAQRDLRRRQPAADEREQPPGSCPMSPRAAERLVEGAVRPRPPRRGRRRSRRSRAPRPCAASRRRRSPSSVVAGQPRRGARTAARERGRLRRERPRRHGARAAADAAGPLGHRRRDQHPERPRHRLDHDLGRAGLVPLAVRLVGGRRREAVDEARAPAARSRAGAEVRAAQQPHERAHPRAEAHVARRTPRRAARPRRPRAGATWKPPPKTRAFATITISMSLPPSGRPSASASSEKPRYERSWRSAQ